MLRQQAHEKEIGVLPIYKFKGKEQLWGYFSLKRNILEREKAKPLTARNTCSHFAKARTKSDQVQGYKH